MSTREYAAWMFLVAVPCGTVGGTFIGALVYLAQTGRWLLW